MRIAALVGSLRKESWNRAVFNTVVELVPEGLEIQEAPINDLPLFNADNENPFPDAVQKFKQQLDTADGILIITPEYNRSVPGVLKNAIDWASRPDGGSSWKGKPVAVMGATNGRLGTAPAQMHLKGVLVYLETKPMGQPEMYLSGVKSLIGDMRITDEDTRKRIEKFLAAFKNHIQS